MDHNDQLHMVFLRLIAELNGWNSWKSRSIILVYYIVVTEKLAEYRTFLQVLPLFRPFKIMYRQWPRNICYVLALRKNAKHLIYHYVPVWFVVIFLELYTYFKSYNGSYNTCNWCCALTPFLWDSKNGEQIMEFYERVSGARLHAALFSAGRC